MPWLDEKSPGPLSGVKVIDISNVVFGPFGSQILGDLGADVIKIENGSGDMMRYAGQSHVKGLGPIYLNLNRNKRALNMDLSQDDSKAVLVELIKGADVFFHNVRAAGIKRLGFDYETVKKINPSIVYVHCCGYGSDGVHEGRQAYDDLIQAASGMAGLLPLSGMDAPKYLPSLLVDKTAGLYSAYATIAALFHRERSGEGQFIEVPMLEVATHFNMVENLYGQTFEPQMGKVAYSRSINPRRKPYKSKDGYIAILPYSDEQWETFFKLGGRPGVFKDPRFSTYEERTKHVGEIYKIIEEVAGSKTTEEWLKLLESKNIPVMRYNELDRVIDDPHLKSVEFFQSRKHPDNFDYLAIKHPVKFSETPATIRRDARRNGADNDDILAQFNLSVEVIEKISGRKKNKNKSHD